MRKALGDTADTKRMPTADDTAAKSRFSNVRERILRGVDIFANAVKVTLVRGAHVNKQLSVAEMEGFIAALYWDRRAARDVLIAHDTLSQPTTRSSVPFSVLQRCHLTKRP